jgi:transketolase
MGNIVKVSSPSSGNRESKNFNVEIPKFDYDRMDDIGFMTAMTLVLMGNYSQTGHFGGPLAYTPFNVAAHLSGPENGGLRFDYRNPKHPYSDKFMLAGGHNAPTMYALWMIMGESLERKFKETNNPKYKVDPKIAMLPIDVLGFRRGLAPLENLLKDNDLIDHPEMIQAKTRGIRALSGHAETTDLTNDVNGGPSGIGIATAAGKAAFWDMMGAPDDLKIIAMEGEFAMTSGHSQEMKTQAVAQQVGKRLRIFLSFNNSGIDDELIGSVIKSEYDGYVLEDQWSSYGWNVLKIEKGNDYKEIISSLKLMEEWDPNDDRPMILIGNTLKGWWPAAVDKKLPDGTDQLVDHASHPYQMKMNSEYFISLANSFEDKFGVKFIGINDGPITNERDRIIQFMTNINIVMSVLDKNNLGNWLSERLIQIGDSVKDDMQLNANPNLDPFKDERLKVSNLPLATQNIKVNGSKENDVSIKLFEEPGNVKGTRRAISEIFKWMNYVTSNKFVIVAADLAESINVEDGSLTGHFDPVKNPSGVRLKAAIQEAGNVSTAIGFVGQSISLDPNTHSGVWALSGTYGAFTPLMYLPARVWSQQNQDSPFRLGVLNILAGHSGPETAADARTHFGIFSPQVWKLFPRGQVITLSFWDYNDVAPGYFAAAEIAAKDPKVGVIVLEVARPDFPVVDRSKFADTDIKAAAKGMYLIRDFDSSKEKHGTILTQGSSSTMNLVNIIPALDSEDINIRIIACISEELFERQTEEYKEFIFPKGSKNDLMIISTGTRRVFPVKNLGPLTDEYSLFSDWNNDWLTGGSESDVIAEAHLDEDSIYNAIKRFANDRQKRLRIQKDDLNSL